MIEMFFCSPILDNSNKVTVESLPKKQVLFNSEIFNQVDKFNQLCAISIEGTIILSVYIFDLSISNMLGFLPLGVEVIQGAKDSSLAHRPYGSASGT